jgi:hypothetical protein
VPPVACSGPDAALPDAALPSRVIRGRVIRATHCYPITPLSYHPLSYHPLSYHQLSLHSRAPTKVPTGSPSADRIPKCRQDSRRPQARGKREGLRCVPNRRVGRTDRSAEPVGRTADFWGTGEPASLPQASNPNNTQPEQHARTTRERAAPTWTRAAQAEVSTGRAPKARLLSVGDPTGFSDRLFRQALSMGVFSMRRKTTVISEPGREGVHV